MEEADDTIPTTTINGDTFQTKKYNPEFALDFLGELGEVLGGPVGNAIGSVANGGDIGNKTVGEIFGDIDGDLFGNAIKRLFKGLNQRSFSSFAKRILRNTKIIQEGPKGKKAVSVKIDRDFQDSLFSILPLCAWVLKVNYENFSKELQDYVGNQAATLISMAESGSS